MSASKSVYKVFRSIFFAASLTVIGLFASLYIAISIPGVQNRIKLKAESELAAFLGSKVEIGKVEILPFNEVRLHSVTIYSPDGQRCVSIGKLGAGVSLWQLLSSGVVEVTYAEIISLDARIIQNVENEPLNIDFIIKAFEPKDKNKPPTQFNVILRNVVIRKSRVSFDRNFKPHIQDKSVFDPNHLLLTDFRADVALPQLTNEKIEIDLRRLAFTERCGLSVGSLSFRSVITPKNLTLSNFRLSLEDSDISINDQTLSYNGYNNFTDALRTTTHSLTLTADPLILSEFSCFVPQLSAFKDPAAFFLDIEGNLQHFIVNNLKFENFRNLSEISVFADVSGIENPKMMNIRDFNISVGISSSMTEKILGCLPQLASDVNLSLRKAGEIKAIVKGAFDSSDRTAMLAGDIDTEIGSVILNGSLEGLFSPTTYVKGTLATENVNIGALLDNSSLGSVSVETEFDGSVSGKDVNGMVAAKVSSFIWNSHNFSNITINADKNGKEVSALIESLDDLADLTLRAEGNIGNPVENLALNADVRKLMPAILGVKGFSSDEAMSTSLKAEISGSDIDNLVGFLDVSKICLKGKKRNIVLDKLFLSSQKEEDERSYLLDSDIISGKIFGNMVPSEMVSTVRGMLREALPAYFKKENQNPITAKNRHSADCKTAFDFTINPSEKFFTILKTPVRPGVPITIKGMMNCAVDSLSLDINAPYLIQGKNKLIRNTSLSLRGSATNPVLFSLSTDFPLKNDRALLSADISAISDSVRMAINWEGHNMKNNYGGFAVGASITKSALNSSPVIAALIQESRFSLNNEQWHINPTSIRFSDNLLEIGNLEVSNGNQFIDITGRASSSPSDVLMVRLSDIDLEYIFDILNIDHVDFGGRATGLVKVSSLFSGAPLAFTDGLFVHNLAYNGCVLGEGNLESHWDNSQKMVAINADITADNSEASVRGGVYVTRDSLSFDFKARHIDVEFLQPFMSGFTSKVNGHASGNLKLYGTFSDIDLGGAVHADDITMLVDYTNVFYSGSDSIFFSPGKITIPGLQLSDKYGNSCHLKGLVTHKYLKDPSFDFQMTDARRLLVYDTDSRMNPLWYGHVFCNGTASLKGRPGMISLALNMSTAKDSEFTLVLDETEEATEYSFLTFSDKRRDNIVVTEEKVSFEDRFYGKKTDENEETSDAFFLNLALDVTPDAKMVIVMDPKAGDKITANGQGALQMAYNTTSDKLDIYGKYTLLNGWYNFSLQDLILKNFKIESGSNVSFNGDPMRGLLDITAAYRVNTNLKDLDAGFENDPDLNRTIVPVDALLKVTGDIHAPEIKFDIDLPTVTSEVDRKVRSIISTEDMLNRQVIYLLALNRFYTPEYMGAEQGGEIASVASSTLSSQIQNIIGSLTDRFTVAPSFKSEKSDFSDMEVDLALSSSFFDNRLLLNGNLGYRDKSTSQTTFIGDFDLEYLLSRDGKLRLKAYNHFNDASYYLKSALTTQGIGVVYRKDFDDPLKFIKNMFRRKSRKPEVSENTQDSDTPDMKSRKSTSEPED